MSRAWSFVVLVLLVLSVLPASASPRAVAPAALDREFMGMVIRDPWYDFGTNPNDPNGPNQDFQDTMGATLAQAGVRWVRLEFHIPVPINGPQDAVDYEIGKYAYFINTVAPTHGLKVLALLNFGMMLSDQGAPIDPCDLNKPTSTSARFGGGVNQYMETWLDRALRIADTFTDKIAAYEILNEENRLSACGTLSSQFSSAIEPAVEGRLITKFYRFCKGIQPLPPGEPAHGCADAAIILGGIHPHGSSPPNNPNQVLKTDVDYLQAIYTDPNSFAAFKNDLAHPYYPVDGVGYHPYPEEIQPSLADERINGRLPFIRQVLKNVGDGSKQFWITEVGYNIAYYKNSLSGQEPFLRDVYTSLAARRLDNGQPEVANVFWFKYEDFPPESGPSAQQWGIVHIPFTPGSCPGGACYDIGGTPSLYRPSFWAYRELAGLPVYRTYMAIVGH